MPVFVLFFNFIFSSFGPPPCGLAKQVAKPVEYYSSQREYQYMKLKHNVDILELIQLGLALCDERGDLPIVEGKYSVWQFNFRQG